MKEKKEINIEIGSRIKKARENAGLTQDRLSELIEMGSKNISAIERGAVGISVSTVQKLCSALSISSDTIFFDHHEIEDDDLQLLIDRLKCLPKEQYELVKEIVNKLFELMTISR